MTKNLPILIVCIPLPGPLPETDPARKELMGALKNSVLKKSFEVMIGGDAPPDLYIDACRRPKRALRGGLNYCFVKTI